MKTHSDFATEFAVKVQEIAAKSSFLEALKEVIKNNICRISRAEWHN